MVENIAREPLNPIDQRRAIERLVALGWTEGGIRVALALPVRQNRRLRLLTNILLAMLEQMPKGEGHDLGLRTLRIESANVSRRKSW